MAEARDAPEIIEVCTAAEALPLTFFDIRWLRLLHIQRLYFYRLSDPEASFHSRTLPRLKRALSLALQHFLPLAGALVWPARLSKPVLACGDGVAFVVARSGADFLRLSRTDNAVSDAAACHSLVPDLPASRERAPVMAVQVTLFPGDGISIGLSMNHAALDGKSFVSFVKSWAYICRSLDGDHHRFDGTLPLELRPSYDRTRVNDDAELGERFSEQWRSMDGPDNRSLLPWELEIAPYSQRGTFQLPRAKLEKLRQLNGHDRAVHASTLALTCAYAWVCLVKAEGFSSGEKTILDIPVDCRLRLEPPLPETYLGNCVGTVYVILERERLMQKDGFPTAVRAIGEAVRSLDEGVLDKAENWVSFLAGCTDGRTYYVVSSHRFEFYSVDFGWGRPRKVDLASKLITGVISLSDSSDADGGIEFGLVLKKREMEAFAAYFVEGLESL